jgi:hypothetical protein
VSLTTYRLTLHDGTRVDIASVNAAVAIETARHRFPSHTIVDCHTGQSDVEAWIHGCVPGFTRYDVPPHLPVNDELRADPPVAAPTVDQTSFPFDDSYAPRVASH